MEILKEHMKSLEDGMKSVVESKKQVLTGLYEELVRQANYASSLTLEEMWSDLMEGVLEYSLEFLSDQISDVEDLINSIKKEGVGKYTDAIEVVLSIFESDTYQYLIKTAKITQNNLEIILERLSDVIIREVIVSLPATSPDFKEKFVEAIKGVNSGNANTKNLRTSYPELVEDVENFIVKYLGFMVKTLQYRNADYETELRDRIYKDLKTYIFLMADFIHGETKFKEIHERYSNELNSFVSSNALAAYEEGVKLNGSDFTDRYYKNREESVPKLVDEAYNFVDEINKVVRLDEFKSRFTKYMTEPISKFFEAQHLMESMTVGDDANIVNISKILSEINVIDDLKLIGIKYDMKELVDNELIWTNRMIVNEDDSDFIRIREAILEKIRQSPKISYKYPSEIDNLMKTIVYGLSEAISKFTKEYIDWDEEKLIDDAKANIEKVVIVMSTLDRNMGYTETTETMLALNAVSFPKLIVLGGVSYLQSFLISNIYLSLSYFIEKSDDIEKAMLLLGDYINIDIIYKLPNLVDNIFYYLVGKYIDFTPVTNVGPQNDKIDILSYIDKVKIEIKKVEESLDIFTNLKKLV